ncbi:MAG: GAF domain-containing protein [Chloroflexota bacterium]
MSGQIAQFQGETVTITSFIDITERQEAVALLEANERRYQQILDAITHMVLVKGSESRIVWANKAFREYYGMSNEVLQNLIDAPFNEPDYTLQYVKDDAYVYETGTVLDIPEEIVTRYDGHEGLFHTVKSPIYDADNQIIMTVGVSEEISERKRVEAAMTKQAVELQTVADLSTAVSKTLDTEQLLQEVVDRTKESFNLYHAHIYLLDEANGVLKLAAGAGEVGAQMVAVGYSIQADHPHSLVAQAAQSKQGVIVNNVAADPAFLPNPLLPNTKSEMAVPMIVGNKVIGVLDIQADTVDYFTHTDVNIQTTLAAQTAVALENARAFEQARQSTIIIDNTTNIIATMSLEQKILSLNNAGLRRLGYESLADVQGQNVSVLFPKDGAEERRTPAIMAVQQQGYWRGESMLTTKSGERFPVEQVITMIRDENGMPQMLIFNMTDITEQKEAELAQQALTAELEEQLERVNALQRAMTREGWQAYMTASKRPFQGFEFNQDGVKALIARDFIGGKNGKSQIAHTNGASQVVNPVKIHGATIGQIGARNANGEPLSDAQRELLAALTNQVAEALERARLSEQTQIALTDTEHREQELAILNAMAQSLTAQTTVEGVLAVVHEYTERLMASDEFYVAFFTAATNEIVFAYGVTEGRIIRNYGRRQAGKGLTEHVLQQRQPILIASDIDKYLHEIGIEAIGRQAASWMGCPLQYGEQVIGLISLQSYATPYAYDEQSLRLLSAIANQAAIAIENARLIEATDQRARQEQLLREVSAKVGAAVDAESVLQTAAREIGRALGLETFVYLKDPKKNQ